MQLEDLLTSSPKLEPEPGPARGRSPSRSLSLEVVAHAVPIPIRPQASVDVGAVPRPQRLQVHRRRHLSLQLQPPLREIPRAGRARAGELIRRAGARRLRLVARLVHVAPELVERRVRGGVGARAQVLARADLAEHNRVDDPVHRVHGELFIAVAPKRVSALRVGPERPYQRPCAHTIVTMRPNASAGGCDEPTHSPTWCTSRGPQSHFQSRRAPEKLR